MVQRAFKFPLDPSAGQAAMFGQHAAASRYAWNWAHALTTEAMDARDAEQSDGGEPVTHRPGRFEIGPAWTVFKNTATGCRRCRHLLAPAAGGQWADARTGTLTCPEDGQDPQSPEAPHEPTIVTCGWCAQILHQDTGGTWCGPDSETLCWEGRPSRCPAGHKSEVGERFCGKCGEPAEPAPHGPDSEYMDWIGRTPTVSLQAVFRDVDDAWAKHLAGKRGRPRFKKKGRAKESFKLYGDLDVRAPRHEEPGVGTVAPLVAVLPGGERVRVMPDTSRHPAMARSFSHDAQVSIRQARAAIAAAEHRLARKKRGLAQARRHFINVTQAPRGAFALRSPAEMDADLDAARRAQERLDAAIAAAERLDAAIAAAERAQGKLGAAAQAHARVRPTATTRHMGGRRRARVLMRQLRDGTAKAAELAPLLRQAREDAGMTLTVAAVRLGAEADRRAQAEAARAASVMLHEAEHDEKRDARETWLEEAIDEAKAAGDIARRRELQSKLTRSRTSRKQKIKYATDKAANAAGAVAGHGTPFGVARKARDSGETPARLAAAVAKIEATGVTTAAHADIMCTVYGLAGERRAAVMEAAAQARIIRATISRGADGLWWLTLGAEVPVEHRTAPSRAQRAGGIIGIDLGVREIATCSDGVTIANPGHLESAMKELRQWSKAMSRRQQGSKGWEEARRQTGLIHADVARLRADAHQRSTTILLRGHAAIAVEGFNIQEMVQRRRGGKVIPAKPDDSRPPRDVERQRARALMGAGVGQHRQLLLAKGPQYATRVLVTKKNARTGRTCSVCRRARTKPLRPHHELFTSDRCAHSQDRRRNTADALAGWAAQELGLRGSGPHRSRGGDVRPDPVSDGQRPSPAKRAQASLTGTHRRGEPGTPSG